MANFLIVDDSGTMRKIIARTLRQAGFEVDQLYEAADGFEGLTRLLSVQKVDMILSDINMPNMDGLEFIQQVQARGYKIPIVVITTEGGEELINQAIELGAIKSIKKPFTPAKLREELEDLLK